MKSLKKILFLCGLILFCSGCEKKAEPTNDPPFINIPGCAGDTMPAGLRNESGHRIAIVPVNPYSGLPDSLVLENNQIFRDMNTYSGILFSHNEKTKIYYDEQYLIYADQLLPARDFTNIGPYEYEGTGEETRYVFTFVEKDYLYAVEHGTDLQATE